MKHGPLDVAVLAFGEPQFDGSIFTEYEKQAAAGTPGSVVTVGHTFWSAAAFQASRHCKGRLSETVPSAEEALYLF